MSDIKPKILYHGSGHKITDGFIRTKPGSINNMKTEITAAFATSSFERARLYAMMREIASGWKTPGINSIYVEKIKPNFPEKVYVYELDSDGFEHDTGTDYYSLTDKPIKNVIEIDVMREIQNNNIRIYVLKDKIDFTSMPRRQSMDLWCKTIEQRDKFEIYKPNGAMMKVNFQIMPADEAWQYILDTHANYHKKLKQFGYKYDMFIPQWAFLYEMFELSRPLTPQEIEYYRDKFFSMYNEKQLHTKDEILKTQAKPALEHAADVLSPFAKKWGINVPNDITIKIAYGFGASYRTDENVIILRGTRMLPERVIHTLQHELVHLIIEKEIIQKYNVPQDLKERIVDIIGYEYFDITPQTMFMNSFANKYITRTAIENDLPGAVQKMMADFVAMNQKIANMKSNG